MNAFKKTNQEILETLKSPNFSKEIKGYTSIAILLVSFFAPVVIFVALALSTQSLLLSAGTMILGGIIAMGSFKYIEKLLKNMGWL